MTTGLNTTQFENQEPREAPVKTIGSGYTENEAKQDLLSKQPNPPTGIEAVQIARGIEEYYIAWWAVMSGSPQTFTIK